MKNSMKMISKFLFVLGFSSIAAISSAQEFSVGTDLVSSYVWRGVPQYSGSFGIPSIQPYASFSVGGLTVGAWGSGSFTGSAKEFDLYASYAINDLFTATVTDYNWLFSESKDYFYYGDSTDHVFEATIAYGGVESFPLTASVNFMFLGADKLANGDQAYSTYVELGYPLASNVNLFLGASLMESGNYATDGFGLTNVGIKVKKDVEISDKFSLPVYGVAGFNPSSSNAFLVVGISL